MIADKWFQYYGLSNAITFSEEEYDSLITNYPQIHKLADLEVSQLPTIIKEITNKSSEIISSKNRIMSLISNISSNQFHLNRFIETWKEIKDETGKIFAFARYQIGNDGENLSSLIQSDFKSLENINISNIQIDLENLETEKNILINNISNLRFEYGIK